MRTLFLVLAIIFTLGLIGTLTANIVISYQFDIGCGDYLKLAANAPTIERSTEFLGNALNYIEKENKTKGNSAFLIKTPASDVGIWYGQIKNAYETIHTLVIESQKNPDSVTQLTKDNALMKIREVILDDGVITGPGNLDTFPNHFLFLWLYLISIILAILFWILFFAFLE